MDDLKEACAAAGIEMEAGKTHATKPSLLVRVGEINVRDREGFSFCKKPNQWEIVGASNLGSARGLSFIADRVRVTGQIPDLEVLMDPAFQLRFAYMGVGSLDLPDPPFFDKSRYNAVLDVAKGDIRRAFRYGANHILLSSTNRISKWTDPPQSERTGIYRQLYSEIATESHRYGMKCLTIADEFLYQDRMLEQEQARLSPDNGGFWNILQNRYRDIFTEVPDLDGIGVRIGEMHPIGNIRSFDVIHNDSMLSLEEKYRRFVGAMYQVIVNEFDKLYYHRTWVVNDWEQHSVESIFRSIFEGIPTRNMIISIKLTKTDQWWYQAFNPNFGQTRHDTSVELEMAHGPHGSMAYPDYMGEWLQAGLNYVLGRGTRGAFFGFPTSLWMDAHHYAAMRLLWDPSLSPEQLAEDWASKIFGRKAAKPIAKLLLLSNDAMEKALYIRPYASTHAWNPISHIFTGLFVVQGDPLLDKGKKHAKFLRELYLLSKPHYDETLSEPKIGMRIYEEMLSLFRQAKPHMTNKDTLRQVRTSLSQGKIFLALNVAYVTAFMSFFRYEEEATETSRKVANGEVLKLRKALQRYKEKVGWFDTIGIDSFLELADFGLADLRSYRKMLKGAPGEFETQNILKEAREKDTALTRQGNAEKILYFEADVDGVELLIIKDTTLDTRHISDEASTGIRYEFFTSLPRDGIIAIKPIEVRGWAYVVEQPSDGNGWTAKIMVKDPQNGRSVYKFEVYWIPTK